MLWLVLVSLPHHRLLVIILFIIIMLNAGRTFLPNIHLSLLSLPQLVIRQIVGFSIPSDASYVRHPLA